jgi:hypothetical protein
MNNYQHMAYGWAKVVVSVSSGAPNMRIELVEAGYPNRLIIDIDNCTELEWRDRTREVPVEDEALQPPDPGGKVRTAAVPHRGRRRGVPDGTTDGQDQSHD